MAHSAQIKTVREKLRRMPPLSDSHLQFVQCLAGHQGHESITVHRPLKGQPLLPDAPPIPERLTTDLRMCVYDWMIYGGDEFNKYDVYCPGQDVISYSIAKAGIWEAYETLIVLDIVTEPDPGMVIDFGSQIGYYSVIARKHGRETHSLDSLRENIQMLSENYRLNGYEPNQDDAYTYLTWIDEASPILPANEDVQLIKIDIEGAEKEAVRMCSQLISNQKVKYLLIEVSPVFNDSYPKICEFIVGCGYDVYQVPSKGWIYSSQFSEQPVATIKEHCQLKVDLPQYISNLHQENFLFIRKLV